MTFLSIDDIDKTIYEYIRREVVSQGFLPDILLPNYSDNRQVLKDSLANGQLIDVFAPAPWQSRDMKELSRFVIDRTDSIKGKIGGGALIEERYTEGGVEKIRIYRTPSVSRTLVYEVRFCTDNVEYELKAHEVIAKVFGFSKNVLCLSERPGTVALDMRIVWKGEYNATKYDFYERVFTYHVEDLFLDVTMTELDENYVPIKEIRLNIDENNQTIATELVT